MARHTISKLWIAGVLVTIPGWVLIPASALTLADHLAKVTVGDFSSVPPDDFSRRMMAGILLGAAFLLAGVVIQLVAWIGAVMSSRRLAGPEWRKAMVWVGIFGIATLPLFGTGFLILGGLMIAYLVGAPDGLASSQSTGSPPTASPGILAKRTIALWLAWAVVAMVIGPLFTLAVSRATNPGAPLQGQMWLSLALIDVGPVVAAGGVIALSVAWWGALFNAHRLVDRPWFSLLLWSGIVGCVTSPLLGLGVLVWLGAVVAFLRAGPEVTATDQPATTRPATAQSAFPATS